MNLIKKFTWGLTVVAMAPLCGLENKERNRRLEDRLKRIENRDLA